MTCDGIVELTAAQLWSMISLLSHLVCCPRKWLSALAQCALHSGHVSVATLCQVPPDPLRPRRLWRLKFVALFSGRRLPDPPVVIGSRREGAETHQRRFLLGQWLVTQNHLH